MYMSLFLPFHFHGKGETILGMHCLELVSLGYQSLIFTRKLLGISVLATLGIHLISFHRKDLAIKLILGSEAFGLCCVLKEIKGRTK